LVAEYRLRVFGVDRQMKGEIDADGFFGELPVRETPLKLEKIFSEVERAHRDGEEEQVAALFSARTKETICAFAAKGDGDFQTAWFKKQVTFDGTAAKAQDEHDGGEDHSEGNAANE